MHYTVHHHVRPMRGGWLALAARLAIDDRRTDHEIAERAVTRDARCIEWKSEHIGRPAATTVTFVQARALRFADDPDADRGACASQPTRRRLRPAGDRRAPGRGAARRVIHTDVESHRRAARSSSSARPCASYASTIFCTSA